MLLNVMLCQSATTVSSQLAYHHLYSAGWKPLLLDFHHDHNDDDDPPQLFGNDHNDHNDHDHNDHNDDDDEPQLFGGQFNFPEGRPTSNFDSITSALLTVFQVSSSP